MSEIDTGSASSRVAQTQQTTTLDSEQAVEPNKGVGKKDGRAVTIGKPLSPDGITRDAARQGGAAGQAVRSVGVPGMSALDKVSNSATAALANAGNIPQAQKEKLATILEKVSAVDKQLLEASRLIEKSQTGPLSEEEQQTLSLTLNANKYNLNQLQLVAAEWQSTVADIAEQAPDGKAHQEAIRSAGQEIHNCIADRHMYLADMMCLYDIDETPPQDAVTRYDRIAFNLVDAKAAVLTAQGLPVNQGDNAGATTLTEERKQMMITALERHVGRLEAAMALEKGEVPQEQGVQEDEMWSHAFELHKNKTSKDDVAALHDQWNQRSQSGKGEWLPLSHPRLGQGEMLREFIKHCHSPEDGGKSVAPKLKHRYQQASNQVLNQREWPTVEKQLSYYPKSYEIGGSSEPDHTATSVISPAKNRLEPSFETRYPQNTNGINCSDRLQCDHVPNLATTELKREDGSTMFSALRHGILDPYDVSASTLRELPDAELQGLAQEFLVPESMRQQARENPGLDMSAVLQPFVDDIKAGGKRADELATEIRDGAARKMAKELATSALVMDGDKLQRALSGEVVDLNLNSISLVTPDRIRPFVKPHANERAMLQRQTQALKGLEGNEVTLAVRDGAGELKEVRANIKVRAFNFGVNGGAVGKMMGLKSHMPVWNRVMGWGYAMAQNNPELEDLLGPMNDPDVSGAVQRKFVEMDDVRKTLQIDAAKRAAEASGGSAEDEAVQQEAAQRELDRNLAQRGQMMQAARQVKDIWREGSYDKGGDDPYKMVSRLGVLVNLMDGESLAFNCKSGKDRTGQLDSNLKCLAAIVDSGAPLPEPGVLPESQRRMQSDFTMQAGNLEMQRMTAGLPGYKLTHNQLPGLKNYSDPALRAQYRGGSAFVKA